MTETRLQTSRRHNMSGIFGDNDLTPEEIDALFGSEDQQETPPANEETAHSEESAGNQDKGDEKIEQTKAFAKRLRESTDKARNEEREAIAKQMGFESYEAMMKTREDKIYENHGVDREQIGTLVDEIYEERRKNDPAFQELDELRKMKQLEFGKKELAEITKLTNGEITSFSQLPKDVLELWAKEGSLKSAFLQLKGEELIIKARSEQSKGSTQHLINPSGGPAPQSNTRPLTDDEKSIYRYFNPGITDEELNKKTKPIS